MNGNFAWDFPGGWYGLGSVFLILLAVSALSAWTTRRPVGTGIRLLMTLTRAGAFALSSAAFRFYDKEVIYL